MTFQKEKMLSEILENMLYDLSCHKRDRNYVLTQSISERLNKSLQTYYKELNNSVSYLSSKDEMKVLKKMNRE